MDTTHINFSDFGYAAARTACGRVAARAAVGGTPPQLERAGGGAFVGSSARRMAVTLRSPTEH